MNVSRRLRRRVTFKQSEVSTSHLLARVCVLVTEGFLVLLKSWSCLWWNPQSGDVSLPRDCLDLFLSCQNRLIVWKPYVHHTHTYSYMTSSSSYRGLDAVVNRFGFPSENCGVVFIQSSTSVVTITSVFDWDDWDVDAQRFPLRTKTRNEGVSQPVS